MINTIFKQQKMQPFTFNWPLYVNQGFIFPYLYSMPPITLQTPVNNSSISQSQRDKKVQEILEISKQQRSQILISLTKEDLIAGGYQTDKKPWSQQEDQVLKKMAKKQKMEWEEIAKHLPGRNPKMCYNRYRRLEYATKKPWTSKEKSIIMEQIRQFGKDWHKIAGKLEGRSVKQIKDHYTHYLDPELNLSPWCLEQDIKLINLIKKYGFEWKKISENFTHRTQFQIKNRYFGKLKKMDQRKKQKQQKITNMKKQQSN